MSSAVTKKACLQYLVIKVLCLASLSMFHYMYTFLCSCYHFTYSGPALIIGDSNVVTSAAQPTTLIRKVLLPQ